ncbi:MAG TPA: Na+/H+ antiporter NhaA [Ignavibacteriaceae bacterium]|nr:Na+/H+ antiporter NhaA [Ignavibacteriaceae bacterium]
MPEIKENPPIKKIILPFQSFFQAEAAGGILLLIFTAAALIWANSAFKESYFGLWHTNISINFGNSGLSYSLHHWINDGLMVVFFFLVGLEIKREFLVGELSTRQKASLPVAGALGGMILPAVIYALFNSGSKGSAGWGIPMATDIAFVIGIFALLGPKVPLSLKVFITALAIADDIGAVLVIAFFYTSEISLLSLLVAFLFLILLIVSNILGVRSVLIYLVLGIGLWLAFLKSGIHTTIAGVILAFTIPATIRINSLQFFRQGKELLDDFDKAGEETESTLTNEERLSIVQSLEHNCKIAITPLQRFESALHPWISFFVMPLFAFANAGVEIKENIFSSLTEPVSLGIIAGLFLGKQLGIFSFSWLAIKAGIASKPEGVSWKNIYPACILAGIGFTMSLFIANLAFGENELLNIGKVGILSGSLLSGITGYFLLKSSLKKL